MTNRPLEHGVVHAQGRSKWDGVEKAGCSRLILREESSFLFCRFQRIENMAEISPLARMSESTLQLAT
jgi:hypothetical protein